MEAENVKQSKKAKRPSKVIVDRMESGAVNDDLPCDCPIENPSVKCKKCFVKKCWDGTITIPVRKCTYVKKVFNQTGDAQSQWGKPYTPDGFPDCHDGECTNKKGANEFDEE